MPNATRFTGLVRDDAILADGSAKAARFGFAPVLAPQEVYNGDGGNNTYTGTAGADTINGNGGNDILAGAAGADTIDGGDNDDFISSYLPSTAYNGDYWIYWHGISADVFADHDTLTGGAGHDVLLAGYGDSVDGGTGQNWLYINLQGATSGVTVDFSTLYNGGSITIGGGTITNIYGVVDIQGSEFGDTIKDFAMSLSPAAGLYGRGGDDNLTTGSETKLVDGGDGNDTINAWSSVYSIQVFGGNGDDTIIGSGQPGWVSGGDGNDTIHGTAGTVHGDAGNDHLIAWGDSSSGVALHGDDGDDVISADPGTGAQMYGGTGADILTASERGSSMATDVYSDAFFRSPDDRLDHDQVFGGAGDDFVSIGIGDVADGAGGTNYLSMSFRGSANGITLNTANILGSGAHAFMGGTISNFQNVEFLWGSSQADTFVIADQTGFAPTVYAGGGNDTVTAGSRGGEIRGEAGDDVLNGGTGFDLLEGGAGRDELRAGDNDDVITIRNVSDQVAGEVVDGGAGTDTLRIEGPGGSLDFSTSTFSGIEHIEGISFATVLKFNVAQLAGITNLSIVDISLANAGSLVLSGVTLDRVLHFYLSTAGNTLDLRGTVTFAGTSVHGNSGNDTVYGTAFADTIQGGGGDDWIDGGAGTDTMIGGDGNDTYIVDGANETVTEIAGQGTDTVRTALVAYTLGNEVENLIYTGSVAFTGTGNGLANVITGGTGNDTLSGLGGDDTLTGGAGADSLDGGTGNDTYIVTDLLDTITDSSGTDTVLLTLSASATYTLTAGIEKLTFGGAVIEAHGNSLANTIVGDNLGQTMYGEGGSDTLIGGTGVDNLFGGAGDDTLPGGAGADNLYGGADNDLYSVDNAGDLTFEDANGGNDSVYATVSHYLYANVENLTLLGTANLYGVGNELGNILTGNEGDNLLLGGAGADSIRGGAGNDSLFGETGNDQLRGGDGIDYLVGGDGVDSLEGEGGADALYGEDGDDILWGGTDFATDILVGGSGNDILHGDSKLGDYDRMDGGAGDDTYYVDTGDDLTFEATDGGTDTVYADVAGANNGVYLYANVENLVLLGTTTFGVGNELANVITGNASNNWLLGGAGNDTLNGKGGNDVLFGEGGADTFVFEKDLHTGGGNSGGGADVIGDFAVGTDKIDLRAYGLTWQAIQNSLHQNGNDTAIDLGNGDLIVLNGVAANSLSQSDFILANSSSGGSEARIFNHEGGVDGGGNGFIDLADVMLQGGPAHASFDIL